MKKNYNQIVMMGLTLGVGLLFSALSLSKAQANDNAATTTNNTDDTVLVRRLFKGAQTAELVRVKVRPVVVPQDALGQQRTAGEFQVALSTLDSPRSGNTTFQARVTRNGQPLVGAQVKLNLQIPNRRLDQAVKPILLTGDPEGLYQGTARLITHGQWKAQITVRSGQSKGSTTYRFTAHS